jgi:hypothetical protein
MTTNPYQIDAAPSIAGEKSHALVGKAGQGWERLTE